MSMVENMSPCPKRIKLQNDSSRITEYFQESKANGRETGKWVLRNCKFVNKVGGCKEDGECLVVKGEEELVKLGYVGSGGFGKVFKVKTAEGGVYALKCLDVGDDSSDSDMQEYLECKLQRSISHENIVKAYQWIQNSPGRCCILMEYCSEGNLYDYICLKGFPLNSRRSKKYVANIIDGLVHLQTEVGFIHMDMKPENVLVSSNDVAKITDFGCVVQMASFRDLKKTHNGGTTTYMPPEMLRKQGFDSTVDVWGLGCITYELYFHVHPFFPDLVKSSFECSPELEQIALLKMDEACSGRLFDKCSRKLPAQLKSFINSILGTPREKRPLTTELRNLAWLKRYK